MKDEFKDILKYNELALGKVWNNKEDEIWGRHFKLTERYINLEFIYINCEFI